MRELIHFGTTLNGIMYWVTRQVDHHILLTSLLSGIFRVGHPVGQFSFVELHFVCSTPCLFLLELSKNWQKWLST